MWEVKKRLIFWPRSRHLVESYQAALVETFSGTTESSGRGTSSATGSRAVMVVPVPFELISRLPPSCRSLSRMPLIPTPGVPFKAVLARFSAGIPLPLSAISTSTSPFGRRRRIFAVRLSECRWMFVRHSCTTRKAAISISRGSRPSSLGKSRSTVILLRCTNPSTYQRSADSKPASSSRGGCRR